MISCIKLGKIAINVDKTYMNYTLTNINMKNMKMAVYYATNAILIVYSWTRCTTLNDILTPNAYIATLHYEI